MKKLFILLALTISGTAFADATDWIGVTGPDRNGDGKITALERQQYRHAVAKGWVATGNYTWTDMGVRKKCWDVGGSGDRKICGYVREFVNYKDGISKPVDLNGDGKISAYERSMWQADQNESP